jgi:hypothetical protein
MPQMFNFNAYVSGKIKKIESQLAFLELGLRYVIKGLENIYKNEGLEKEWKELIDKVDKEFIKPEE